MLLVRAHVLRVAVFLVGGAVVVVRGRFPATISGAVGHEAGRVGCRLCAQLGEVEIAACAVAVRHGLSELALRPEAVEDDGVDGDGDGLDHDLDDGAQQAPILKPADQFVVDVVLEEGVASVVDAGPAPHIFVVVVRSRTLKDTQADSP